MTPVLAGLVAAVVVLFILFLVCLLALISLRHTTDDIDTDIATIRKAQKELGTELRKLQRTRSTPTGGFRVTTAPRPVVHLPEDEPPSGRHHRIG